MNVCGYVRVSSDGQTENYSIPQQLKNDVPQEPELSFEDAKKIFEDAKTNFTDTFTVEQQRAILHSLIKKMCCRATRYRYFGGLSDFSVL